MFLSSSKKNNAYPCKPQFYYIKVGFKGVKIIKVFRDAVDRTKAELGLLLCNINKTFAVSLTNCWIVETVLCMYPQALRTKALTTL